jgi:hypothetical protein
MSYRLSRPLVSFFRPKASQPSDFGRPRASPCNDTPHESEITTARLKFKSRFDRLGRDRIDLLLLHGPHRSDITDELCVALSALRSEGIVGSLDGNFFDVLMLDYNVPFEGPLGPDFGRR